MPETPTLYIRQWRRHRGLSQFKLAVAADCGIDAVSRWENGHRSPTMESLGKLAEALGCAPPDLFAPPPPAPAD